MFILSFERKRASVTQVVKKHLPMQGTWVQSLVQETWKRKWQPTLVFLPGKSHGQWSRVVTKRQT